MDQLGIGHARRDTRADTPIAVVSHTFPVDTTTLTQVRTFLNGSLSQASLTRAELDSVYSIVADALADVDETTQALHVGIRVTPHSIEVEALLSDDPPSNTRIRVAHGHRHRGQP